MSRRCYDFASFQPEPEKHPEYLAAGLEKLGPEFNAHICGVCEGHGRYSQTYTLGCGMGTYRSMGVCGWCNGSGLMQQDSPAPDSVLNQVLTAGGWHSEKEKAFR